MAVGEAHKPWEVEAGGLTTSIIECGDDPEVSSRIDKICSRTSFDHSFERDETNFVRQFCARFGLEANFDMQAYQDTLCRSRNLSSEVVSALIEGTMKIGDVDSMKTIVYENTVADIKYVLKMRDWFTTKQATHSWPNSIMRLAQKEVTLGAFSGLTGNRDREIHISGEMTGDLYRLGKMLADRENDSCDEVLSGVAHAIGFSVKDFERKVA